MSEPIRRCQHTDAPGCVASCDCGREVAACNECLANGKVLACGQCGIAEAIIICDGSLALTRKYLALEADLQDTKGEESKE